MIKTNNYKFKTQVDPNTLSSLELYDMVKLKHPDKLISKTVIDDFSVMRKIIIYTVLNQIQTCGVWLIELESYNNWYIARRL